MRDALLRNACRLKVRLRRSGFEVVRRGSGTLLGLHLWTLFARYEINAVIDVGACSGEYGTWLRRNGYKGLIVSFEPVPESFSVLAKKAARDPLWLAYNLALGREPGEAEINVTENTMFSSFRRPSPYAFEAFGSMPKIKFTETVTLATLDEMFDQVTVGISRQHVYLKMDTQGWDLDVLEGAKESLGRIVAFQSEVAVQAVYEDVPSMRESLDYFERCGYSVSGLFPVNLDEKMRAVEFDCVMVRSPAAQ
jgi:FkbM family methyltransferase